MKKQILVIGLGEFGMSLARSLAERGAEVLAVDVLDERIRMATEFAAEAVVLDATDETALSEVAPKRRDLCVCAIGADSREASIIVTALLRQLGAERVVARAIDSLHERILRLIGAEDVVNPERAFGERYASHLFYEEILEELPLGTDLVVTELETPEALIGRNLSELSLPRRFGVTVAALRRSDGSGVTLPEPSTPLAANDQLVLVSRPGAVGDMLEKLG